MATSGETDGGDLQQWLVHSVKSMHLTSSESVEQWLEDLRLMTDSECMCVLQGKSLTQDTTDLIFTAARSSRDSINTIKGRAHVIGTEFSKLYRHVEKERWKHVKSGSLRLTCQIRSLLHECNASISQATPAFNKQEKAVMEGCARLAQYVDSYVEMNGHKPDKTNLTSALTHLGQGFSAIVDLSLGVLLQNLLKVLQDNISPHDVKATLSSLVSLGLEGEHMCYLITKESGMDVLLAVIKDSSMDFAHAQALRAIATLCCVSESIAELDQLNGISCLSDILGDMSMLEAVRAEAAGVIAQVTSPCLEKYQHLTGFIENLQDLVNALTVLCVEASTPEVFLLGSAALANITYMDNMACDYLLQYDTAKVLIEACMLNKAETLFAKDQVATVLANMSGVESCTRDIMDNHGVALLVHLLYEQPQEAVSGVEIAACERVQQKSAIALTRLGRDKEAANIIVELGALPRLVDLCRDPSERNNSDAVLVACLAALRKVCSSSGLLVDDLDATIKELVEPKLMDSFIMCSSLNESIV